MRTAWNKGKKMSEAYREKCRLRIGPKNNRWGIKHSAETKEKMRLKRLGTTLSMKTRLIISRACIGKPAWNSGKVLVDTYRNHLQRVHKWLAKKYGRPCRCDNPNCIETTGIYYWAKKTECTYDYNVNNFMRLCSKCHHEYDHRTEKMLKTKELKCLAFQ